MREKERMGGQCHSRDSCFLSGVFRVRSEFLESSFFNKSMHMDLT
jgi:hypothetical protein